MSATRTAEIERSTKETKISLKLNLDGGEAAISTGVGFLDHMLELLARHGRLGLTIEASGDLETGAHHTTEDVGIVLGQAIDEAPKSTRWKMRARVGERVAWYSLPEEVGHGQ